MLKVLRVNKHNFQDKAYRAAWFCIWLTLFRSTPFFMFKWRIQLLSLFGAHIDISARIYPSVRVRDPSKLIVKPGVGIGPMVNIYNNELVQIDQNVNVSSHVTFCTADRDYMNNFRVVGRPIIVGRDSWVAMGAFIGPGVKIYENAIVGAKAVVFKDVKTGGRVVGNPAQYI